MFALILELKESSSLHPRVLLWWYQLFFRLLALGQCNTRSLALTAHSLNRICLTHLRIFRKAYHLCCCIFINSEYLSFPTQVLLNKLRQVKLFIHLNSHLFVLEFNFSYNWFVQLFRYYRYKQLHLKHLHCFECFYLVLSLNHFPNLEWVGFFLPTEP